MIKKLITSLILLASLLFTSSPAFALNVYSGIGSSCSSAPSSAVCQDKNNKTNPITGHTGIIYKITLIIAIVAGIAAVILIVLSAIKFITSGGDPQKVGAARNSLTSTVIGLVIISLAAAIISFILNNV